MNTRIFLTGKNLVRFESVQACIAPRARRFDDKQRMHSRDLVNNVLKDKPALIHFKIGLFLWLIDAVAFFSGFRAFRKLDPEAQEEVLRWFFDSRIGLFRKGFWGVSTLAKLGVYGQEFLHDEIGYHLKETPKA